jgi:hypothetical protein
MNVPPELEDAERFNDGECECDDASHDNDFEPFANTDGDFHVHCARCKSDGDGDV